MKQKQTKKSINYQFRFLYFIGILAVVFGHAGGGLSLFFDWFKPQAII